MSDGDAAEFEELRLAETGDTKVEQGLEYDSLSLQNQRWIESNYNSPTTLYDEPVPWRFWKLCHDLAKRAARKTQSEKLRAAREVACAYYTSLVKNRVNGMTPFRSQLDLHDLLVLASPSGDADQDVMACHRLTCYVAFNREYMGRQVG